MKPQEIGKMIAQCRKEAGYTQASLAKALFVTDKAVSKWERGTSCPDSSLLPKLSLLLDIDIEMLIEGPFDYASQKWVGYLQADELDTILCDKPILHYLLSYFMLVGIRHIYIQTNQKDFVRSQKLEQYGLQIEFGEQPTVGNVMIVYDKYLIFGCGLTRVLQSCMIHHKTVLPNLNGKPLPIIFTHQYRTMAQYQKEGISKNFPRGMIAFPLETKQNVENASQFVSVYQDYHGQQIADLAEIKKNRKSDSNSF